ncbi:MAG: (deoxy)nucleoside triphosphate pyrophosphohydrolase [Deltaproteobacteria bacterium]|nr:(deoxy)nucleoside triphosphate pyrophosphohydrolase [Deltaproteobacteria bacterium]MBI3063728.1 (deoxy)nucleoside triphosphate pyrophosphohydrolase [Deltaproteobacteria bacterium]
MSDAIAKHVEVVAALIVREGRLLVCQRHESSEFPLKWEFPGGKVEPGERCEDALTREIKEELAIEIHDPVKIFSHRHFYPGAFEVSLDFFRVTRFSGSIYNRVFQQICWVAVGELTGFDFLEGDVPLITILAGPEGERLLS